MDVVCVREATGRRVGRSTLPQRVCEHACVSHLWSPGAHGRGSGAVFPTCAVGVCSSVAGAEPKKCPALLVEPGRGVAFEVYCRGFFFLFFGVCFLSAGAARPPATRKQKRRPPV